MGYLNYGPKQLADILASTDDLDKVQEALSRERVIRQVVDESGESREIVAEMVDATRSMGEEAVLDLMDAVLDLTDGEPTTLRDALSRYVDSLEAELTDDPNDEETGQGSRFGAVADELTTILNYPWPEKE